MRAAGSHISHVIAAIGRPELPARLLAYLFDTYHVEACAMYRLKQATPVAVLTHTVGSKEAAQRTADTYLQRQFWLRDPAMLEACGRTDKASPWIQHMDVRSLADRMVREVFTSIRIRERLIICGGAQCNEAVLTLVKTDANSGFSGRQRQHIEDNAPTLLAILAKHMQVADGANGVSGALRSLGAIEARVAQADLDLPRREMQVASRIVYGMSNAGIAVDLGVSEETVTTYRKRLYRRLSIGSQRELLALYLELCGSVSGVELADVGRMRAQKIRYLA